MEEVLLPIERSRSGLPCLWEAGGGATNTGDAQVVARPDGGPPRAIYVRRSGTLSRDQHALIPINIGSLVIKAEHHRGDFAIRVIRIVEIGSADALGRIIAVFERGEWLPQPPPEPIMQAVMAARAKSRCYHCREPHYIL
jgi:hypothetical protein